MHGEDFVRELYDASYRRLVGQLAAVTGSREEAEDVVQKRSRAGSTTPARFSPRTIPRPEVPPR